MLNGKKIGVIVPALNEELLIRETVSGIPDYVDSIIVINDGSTDKTEDIVDALALEDSRIEQIVHDERKGLGQSLIDGYLAALESEQDIIAVMAGDNQMHPDDLIDVVSPIAEDRADYIKGNRLFRSDTREKMPTYRYFGNAGLTLLTKFATGYWKSVDPQCGYTAISAKALNKIPIQDMTKGYGYNAHLLWMLNLENLRVGDTEVRPVYDREKSKIKVVRYILHISYLLSSLFFSRLWSKYLVRDFNPLAILYIFSLINL